MGDDLKESLIAKTLGTTHKPEETVGDVKQQTEDMGVIEKTLETARKLSGTDTLNEELTRKDQRNTELQKEKDKATQALHESQIENVKTELASKIDHLKESLKGGATPKSIADEISDIKKAANELGLGGSKFSEIKEIMGLISSLNPKTSLAEQVKEAKDLISALQPAEDKGKEGIVEGVPASVAIELKKMDHTLQITLEEMRDDRQRKDQDFKLANRKYDEERLARQQEVQGKIHIEEQRNQILADGLEIVGRGIGRGMAESGAEAAPPGTISQGPQRPAQAYHLEVPEGELGEFDCPTCKSKGAEAKVGFGPTSTNAECALCKSKFPIMRLPAVEGTGEPAPVESKEE